MNWKAWLMSLRWLLFRRRAESDLDEEVKFHLEMTARQLAARGSSPEEAHRTSAILFGGAEAVKEQCRDVRRTRWLEDFLHDCAFGLRLLRRDRGYTIAATLALALGIGANTAVFTIFNAVVLKALPVPEPQALVNLWRTTRQAPLGGLLSFADYVYYRDHARAFSSMAAETPAHLHLSASPSGASAVSTAEPVDGVFVTANFFDTFGVHPIAGHAFTSDDDIRTAGPYPALLSENYFQRRFGSDPGVLGQTLTVSGMKLLMEGIAPRDFMGTRPEVPDLWIASSALGDARRRTEDRVTVSSRVTARLKPGVSLAQAQAELNLLADVRRADYPPQERAWNVRLVNATLFVSYHQAFVRLYIVLQIAMGLVLLIACTNVAGLLLGRAAARRREIAIRLSTGASRSRLIRQLLTEGILIAVGAGVFAYVCAQQSLSAISRAISVNLASQGGTMSLNLTPDPGMFAYVLGISVLAGISFALLPALQSTRLDVSSALKQETAGFGVRSKSRLRGGMIAAQISVSLALLIGAGLLTLQSVRLLSVDPGFNTRNVIHLKIMSPQELGYSPARTAELHNRLEDRLRALPRVLNVAFSSAVPLGGNISTTRVVPQELAASADQQRFPYYYISRDYFTTLGVPLKRGCDFTAQEIATNAPVAVISEALARRLWPDADPIGHRVAVGSGAEEHFSGERAPLSASVEIIGVVADVYSQDLSLPDAGAIYLPRPQSISGTASDGLNWNALVRVEGGPDAATAALVREVHALDPNLAASAETLGHMISTGEASAAFHVGFHRVLRHWNSRIPAGLHRRLQHGCLHRVAADPRSRHPHGPWGPAPSSASHASRRQFALDCRRLAVRRDRRPGRAAYSGLAGSPVVRRSAAHESLRHIGSFSGHCGVRPAGGILPGATCHAPRSRDGAAL
jgi:putative ABC transport system permease protein